jgi:hypothetical protein
LPVYTTEEIGQVAHAVDELHTQALLLAGDEARLRLLVNDMFETMSRRSRSLVDQQLQLIDRLERNEEDPDRLDSLFRLDHLAARLRRNSANLLVLAGAQLARDQREPVPLATVINAAVSEVEDYRRVEIARVPEATLLGAAAGAAIHLFAELIDNALRYSPPTTSVRITGAPGGDGGVVLRIADAGLGMNDADRRIANTRLQAGGDVTPDNARHMGLFVVGRIAARHGIRVGLRGPGPHEAASGTTAETYLPPTVLVGAASRAAGARARARGVSSPSTQLANAMATTDPAGEAAGRDAAAATVSSHNGSQTPVPPIALLPRRDPGSSGITEVPAAPADQPRRHRRELATPWWEAQNRPEPKQEPSEAPATSVAAVSDTSAFFAARSRDAGDGADAPAAESAGPDAVSAVSSIPSIPSIPSVPSIPEGPTAPSDDDVIYRRMLAEMLGDPHDLVNSPDLDWQSVWDRGWSLAAEAEDKPVESHTAEHGLPVRTPGARLVPGAANGVGLSEEDRPNQEDDGSLVGSNGGFGSSRSGREPQHAAAARDPDAVRASFSSHFGGVRIGRSHARETNQGPDQE